MATASYWSKIHYILQKDSNETPPEQVPHSPGIIQNVDLMAGENGGPHHTGVYHLVNGKLKRAIYRRGQPFVFKIDFSQNFELADKRLRVDFSTGEKPDAGNGTSAQLYVGQESNYPSGKHWSIGVKSKTDRSVVLEAKASASCPIGVWQMMVVYGDKFYIPPHFYIIFNPWCIDDVVYMENEDWKNEYVLNQAGVCFQGDHTGPKTTYFNLNQFFPVSLPTAIYVLERLGNPKTPQFGDPILVTRGFSRAGGGMLVEGRWGKSDAEYAGGVKPWAWHSSDDIFKKFMATPNKLVQFGQCWIFGEITCSLARAVGIPCRIVTCFGAAHDKDKDLVARTIHDINGRVLPEGDTTWNFHVWNDGWMARPDLPAGYGGWQAFDGTQQEPSVDSGIYECGPMSVEAIKKGEIGFKYDAQFIFTEVSADQQRHYKDESGNYYYVDHVTYTVGSIILTKAVGKNDPQDITSEYKYGEGTAEERKAYYHAAKIIGPKFKDFKIPTPKEDDVIFDLLPVESVMIGKPFIASISVENRSKEKRAVDINVGADSVMYTGVLYKHLNISADNGSYTNFIKINVELSPEQKEIYAVSIEPERYMNNLPPMGYVKIFAAAIIKTTKQVWVDDDTVSVLLPKVIVEVPNEVKVGTPFTVTMKFKNPLSKELTNCSFIVNGNCFNKLITFPYRNVKVNEDVTHQVQVTPDHAGPCNVAVTFRSDTIGRMEGAKPSEVIN